MKQVLASQNSYSVWRTSRLINMFSNPLGFLFMFCLRPKIYFSSDGRFQLGRQLVTHSYQGHCLTCLWKQDEWPGQSGAVPHWFSLATAHWIAELDTNPQFFFFFSLPGFGFDDVLPNYVPARSSAGKIGTSGEKNKVFRDRYLRLSFINGFLFFFLVLAAQTWESSVLVLISF